MDATFEDIVKLAEQLEPELQDLLILHLRNLRNSPEPSRIFSREMLLEELQHTRNSVGSSSMSSLYGKFAGVHEEPVLTEAELHTALKEIATEWERELDDLSTEGD